jgi:hypothetical protein
VKYGEPQVSADESSSLHIRKAYRGIRVPRGVGAAAAARDPICSNAASAVAGVRDGLRLHVYPSPLAGDYGVDG